MGAPEGRKGTLTVCFCDGKAFLEVSPNYLLCIGDEAFVRGLDIHELWDLVTATMLAVKYGTQQPTLLPMSKHIH